jgi:uncharacterized phage-associated protein
MLRELRHRALSYFAFCPMRGADEPKWRVRSRQGADVIPKRDERSKDEIKWTGSRSFVIPVCETAAKIPHCLDEGDRAMMGRKGPQRGEALAMAGVQDVAAYILDKLGTVSAMKLQKLCYFAYGYHLAWEERPLFPERFEAWANGPVCRPLYAMHRLQFSISPGDIQGDPGALDTGEKESVDLVLQGYSHFSAHQLSAMTHAAGPWLAARQRACAGPLDSSTERLRDEEIFEFFDALTAADANGRER